MSAEAGQQEDSFLSYLLKCTANGFFDFVDWISNEVYLLYDSFIVNIGVGAGGGVSIKAEGFEATILARYDAFTLRKESGSGFYTGMAEEFYINVEGLYCSFPMGYKKFHYSDESKKPDGESTQPDDGTLTPSFEGDRSIGGTFWLPFVNAVFTLEFGFDFEYYWEQKYFN